MAVCRVAVIRCQASFTIMVVYQSGYRARHGNIFYRFAKYVPGLPMLIKRANSFARFTSQLFRGSPYKIPGRSHIYSHLGGSKVYTQKRHKR